MKVVAVTYVGLTYAQPAQSRDAHRLKRNGIRKGGIMGVKLRKEEQKPGICVYDMKDGDIGEIVDWPIEQYIGRIVQRYKNCLLIVGQDSRKGWSEIFDRPHDNHCRIRLLQPGEMLEII